MLRSRCSECGHRFSEREALCDDWRDPEKAYGCPNCETFFIRDEGPSETRNGIVAGLASGGIMYPTVWIFLNSPYPGARVHAGMIFVSCVLLSILFFRPILKRPVRSPWTDERKEQSS